MLRCSRRLLLTVMLACASIGATAAPALASSDSPDVQAAATADRDRVSEQYLFDELNASRRANGLDDLVRDPALDAIALDWTDEMLPTGTIFHRTDLRDQVETRVTLDWRRIGENVGWGPSAEWLHNGFWNSSGHRANMLGDYNRIGIGSRVEADGDVWVTVNFLKGPHLAPQPVVDPGVELPPIDSWAVSPDGVVTAFGDAPWLGDVSHLDLARPIVGITATPTGNGYWLVASDGGIFTFGDAEFLGSTGAIRLNSPIVSMAPSPSGAGYWMTASDGGIFTFGDAGFHGSTGALDLNSPVTAMAATPSGKGYWLVARDGGVFTFGDARFSGSASGSGMNGPVIGMAPGRTGSDIDYWIYSGTGITRGYGNVTSAPTPEVDPSGSIAGVTVRPG